MSVREVSRFENNLLKILECFLHRASLDQAHPLMYRELPQPRCLSRNCVELVQDRLAKGCLTLLATGGWQRERYLRGENIAEGRLWQRTPPGNLGFEFSPATMKWLIWITAHKLEEKSPKPNIVPDEITSGDQFLFYASFATLCDTLAAPLLMKLPAFATNPLIWLAFPEHIPAKLVGKMPDFDDLVSPANAWVLESLQPVLADRWYRLENAKQQTAAWREVRSLGNMQEHVLAAYLDALERAGRRDLARFMLVAAARLFREMLPDAPFFQRLVISELRLADRDEVYRAGNAFLNHLDRLRQWEQQARTIGYYDEGYTASQLYKADWERLRGEQICERAREEIARLRPFRV